MRDFKRLRNDAPQGVNASPNPDNIMRWNAVIFGPEDTPWDGGACTGFSGGCPCFIIENCVGTLVHCAAMSHGVLSFSTAPVVTKA